MLMLAQEATLYLPMKYNYHLLNTTPIMAMAKSIFKELLSNI